MIAPTVHAAPEYSGPEHSGPERTSSTRVGRVKRPTRPLRSDLQAIHVQQDGRHQVLLVDPMARRYTRLTADRWDQLQRLNTDPDAVDPQLSAEAASAGLLRCPVRPPARRWGLAGLLAIRLPGVPADRLARWLSPRTGWLFSPVAVVGWLLLILAAGLAVLVYWERFTNQLPRLGVFLASDNWLPLALTLAVTKTLHELAHAVVCRRSGARCGVIGIMLLCGVPCPYCDVTDSWRVASRLRRAAIMLAGVYVELILAALASLVWWSTDGGGLHYAAMNVMVVCGISSLLFNLNPLMRYDGYYVLSDMLNSVQLREEAADAFRTVVTCRLAGQGYAVTPAKSLRVAGLALYHAAAASYRVFVAVLIALWLVHAADSLSLRTAGVAAGSGVLLAIPASGLRQITGMLRGHGRWAGVRWPRRGALGIAVGGLLVAACWLPLPHSIETRGVVDAADATAVYLPAAARIASVDADLGQTVAAGQRLLLLNDPELEVRCAALAGQADVLGLRAAQLRRRAIDYPHVLRQWDTHQAAVQSVEAQRSAAQQARQRLTVVAPRGGVVLPPPPEMLRHRAGDEAASVGDVVYDGAAAPPLPRLNDRRAERLISTTLLAATGASTTADALWCRIGDPQKLHVVLDVDASQRRLVQMGDVVGIRCDQTPERVVWAAVESIDTVDRRHQGALSTESRFRVACRLPADAPDGWRIGTTATARIQLPAQPLLVRLHAWWQEAFGGG